MEVTVREKGRITLPSSVREALGLREGDRLELSSHLGAVVLRPKNAVTVDKLAGILRIPRVDLEETEEALGVLG